MPLVLVDWQLPIAAYHCKAACVMNKAGIFTALMGTLALAACSPPAGDANNSAAASAETDLHGAAIGGPFTLTDQDGKQRSWADFKGRYRLVYFGYTFCPDVCPLTLGDISSALAQMDDGGESVQTVFVTLDPERDTAERLSQYLNFINKSFVGLTGTPEEVAEQASHFGVFYERREGSSPETYFVDHTSQVLVIDKDGYLRMIFPNGVNGEQMAADLSTLRN